MTPGTEQDTEAVLHSALEALLRRTAAGMESVYPPTPDLATRVRQRLATHRPARWRLPEPALLRRAAVVLLAILVLVSIALLIPGVGTALARFLGLDTVRVVPVSTLPVPVATADPRLAGETTLGRAIADATIEVRLPAGQGEPHRVYLQEFDVGEQVVLVYRDFVLYEAELVLYMKLVDQGTTVQELSVNGHPALWLSGAEHVLQVRTRDGGLRTEVERVVTGNVLAWEEGSTTYRLETRLPLDAALAIAASLR